MTGIDGIHKIDELAVPDVGDPVTERVGGGSEELDAEEPDRKRGTGALVRKEGACDLADAAPSSRRVAGGRWTSPNPRLRARHRTTPAAAPNAPAQRPTDIATALRQALTLIDGALAEHRGAAGASPVAELAGGDEALTPVVRTLVGQARRELVCVALADSMAATGPFRPVADLLRGDGVATGAARPRVLIPARGRQDRRGLRAFAPETGPNQVRVTETALQEMVVADRRTALVVSRTGAGTGTTTRHAVVVTDPALLSTLYGLFVDSWRTAGPLLPVPLLDDPRQRETAAQVLAALRDGQKDDVAARELGMSVRTYRRYVADFMRDIDATSRFQAGVRAAEMRLLPSDPAG